MAVVVDTYVLIWYLRDATNLSVNARSTLDGTIGRGGSIQIASISIVEITYLVEKNRIPAVAMTELYQALAQPNSSFVVVPLHLDIAKTVSHVDRSLVPEMPDRIIAATALYLGMPLVTRDQRIRTLANLQTVW